MIRVDEPRRRAHEGLGGSRVWSYGALVAGRRLSLRGSARLRWLRAARATHALPPQLSAGVAGRPATGTQAHPAAHRDELPLVSARLVPRSPLWWARRPLATLARLGGRRTLNRDPNAPEGTLTALEGQLWGAERPGVPGEPLFDHQFVTDGGRSLELVFARPLVFITTDGIAFHLDPAETRAPQSLRLLAGAAVRVVGELATWGAPESFAGRFRVRPVRAITGGRLRYVLLTPDAAASPAPSSR